MSWTDENERELRQYLQTPSDEQALECLRHLVKVRPEKPQEFERFKTMIETACRKRGIITDKLPDIDNSSELEHHAGSSDGLRPMSSMKVNETMCAPLSSPSEGVRKPCLEV